MNPQSHILYWTSEFTCSFLTSDFNLFACNNVFFYGFIAITHRDFRIRMFSGLELCVSGLMLKRGASVHSFSYKRRDLNLQPCHRGRGGERAFATVGY